MRISGETFRLGTVKTFDGFLDFGRVGPHDDLDFALDGKLNFIGARGIERVGQGNLDTAIFRGKRARIDTCGRRLPERSLIPDPEQIHRSRSETTWEPM